MLSRYLQAEARALRRPPQGGRQAQDARGRPQTPGKLRSKFLEASATSPRRRRSTPRSSARSSGDGYRVEKVDLREPARPPRHREPLPARRQGAVPRRARAVRPQRQRQGGRGLSAGVHPAGEERHGGALLRPDRPGRAAAAARRRRASRPSRAARPSTRWSASAPCSSAGARRATASGTASAASTTSPAGPRSTPKRLGCTGNSGGGTHDRLPDGPRRPDRRPRRPSCYITSLERLFATIGPQDAEQNITGQVAFGMDHADYVTMRAPKPTLLCVGTHDFFDIQGSWDTFREAKLVYGRLGHGERVDLFESDEPHGFTEAAPRGRDALDAPLAARQGRRAGRDRVPRSPPTPSCNARGPARCSRTSTASRSSTSTPNSAAGSRRRRSSAGRTGGALRRGLRGIDRLRGSGSAADRRSWQHRSRRPEVIHRPVCVARAGDGRQVWRATVSAREAGRMGCRTVIYVGAERGGPVRTAGPSSLANAGRRSSRRRPARHGRDGSRNPKRPGFHRRRCKESFLALHLNRPLLGPAGDLFECCSRQALSATIPAGSTVGLGTWPGRSPCTPRCWTAVSRLPSRSTAPLFRGSRSPRTPLSSRQLSSVVPGVLESYDLPDLAAHLAPCR